MKELCGTSMIQPVNVASDVRILIFPNVMASVQIHLL